MGRPRAPPRKWAGPAGSTVLPAACQSGCGRGRSWLCSSLKMAAQPPSGIRLSAVSSREGWSGPCPRRAGRRASEGGPPVGGGDSARRGAARRLGPRRGRGWGRPSLSRRRSDSAAGRAGRRGPGCVPFPPRSVSVLPPAALGRAGAAAPPPGSLLAASQLLFEGEASVAGPPAPRTAGPLTLRGLRARGALRRGRKRERQSAARNAWRP